MVHWSEGFWFETTARVVVCCSGTLALHQSFGVTSLLQTLSTLSVSSNGIKKEQFSGTQFARPFRSPLIYAAIARATLCI